MKQVTGVYTAPRPHWVGDGFPVRSMFSYQSHAEQLSPFLLLDYAGPHTFTPGNEKRGVGEHPHRGFETVTIVYSGEVEHRDSTGRGGIIGPGDVQWMTAGAGILHEEFHSRNLPVRAVNWKWCNCGSICRQKTKWPYRVIRASAAMLFPPSPCPMMQAAFA